MTYITVSSMTEVEIDVDLEEEIGRLSAKDKAKIAEKLGAAPAPFMGEGDLERANTIIERAYLAARQMAELPREVADLFWHVHGRAI